MKKKIFTTGLVLMSSITLGTAVLPTATVLAEEPQYEYNINNDITATPKITLNDSDELNNLSMNNNLSVTNDGLNSEEINLEQFDQFVTVENNQYVLNLPTNHTFSEKEVYAANQQLEFSNKLIFENSAVLDADTEDAYIAIPELPGQMSRAAGRTYVNVYWNYISVGISKGYVQTGITASASAVAGSLAAYYTWGATSTFVSRIVGALVGKWASNKIHSGIWFHLNYYSGINKYGWQ